MRVGPVPCALLAALLLGAPASRGQDPPASDPGRSQEPAPAAEPDWTAAGNEAAALLSRYIQIDTTNPPGNETEAARFLADWFAQQGLGGRVIESAPGRGSFLLTLPATRPGPAERGAILLMSHSDVVPADPAAWSFPPLSGAIENGFVYGRGALDDKGQGAVFAVAMALLHRREIPRSRDLVFLAAADEEVGGQFGAKALVDGHWEALGPPVVVWNEGGVSARNPLVRDRVVNAIATSEKRALWIGLSAEGEGGHGSQPLDDSANNRLLRALARIADYQTPLRITTGVGEMFGRLSGAVAFPAGLALSFIENPLVLRLVRGELEGSRITNAMVRDTIAITSLRSGLKHNVIPRRAEATLDVRLLPDTDADDFLSGLRRVIDDPEVRITDIPDPLPPIIPASPVENELFRALEAEMAREIPESISVPLTTTGGTDSLFFRERGVPAYGYLPVILSDEQTASIHGLDERIAVAELERAVRVTYRTLLRLVE